ncbi:MAG: response regulator receiver protein [Candidatus Magnetoglobus multicellularis str. Araruama]|uniref:Response regulator receiver protein n=1 Tax=Candidatus Magnetoglobus multicellularis str. Araruama TaxID=890399 RepID=A0A1V1PHD0_9BACT|nr:MAG: response regulator receiver protein [Candidatus Magnetoglobus multicellularis str. Araruama]
MQITCDECQGKFRIADEKIPENKSITILCPKCKKKIRVKGRISAKRSDNNKETMSLPFDVLGDEHTALLCFESENSGATIQKNLATMGFKTVYAKNSKEAIKMTRFHPFDLAVIDDAFDSTTDTHILNYLQSLPMVSRRNLFVAFVTDTLRTNDYMGAYCQSANLIINRKQMTDFKTIYNQAAKENDAFYSVYKETLQKFA